VFKSSSQWQHSAGIWRGKGNNFHGDITGRIVPRSME